MAIIHSTAHFNNNTIYPKPSTTILLINVISAKKSCLMLTQKRVKHSENLQRKLQPGSQKFIETKRPKKTLKAASTMEFLRAPNE